MRYIMALVALIFIPFFWIGMNLGGVRMALADFYREWYQHAESKEPWGPFG